MENCQQRQERAEEEGSAGAETRSCAIVPGDFNLLTLF